MENILWLIFAGLGISTITIGGILIKIGESIDDVANAIRDQRKNTDEKPTEHV